MQFHFYADDTQLYISFSTNDDLELTNSIAKIEKCLSDLDQWMSLNKLKLNKDKTELLYLYSKYCPQQSLPPLLYQIQNFVLDLIQFSRLYVPETLVSFLIVNQSINKSLFKHGKIHQEYKN